MLPIYYMKFCCIYSGTYYKTSSKTIFCQIRKNSIKNRFKPVVIVKFCCCLGTICTSDDIRPLCSSQPVTNTISSLQNTNHVKNIFKKSTKSHLAYRTRICRACGYVDCAVWYLYTLLDTIKPMAFTIQTNKILKY